MAWLGANLGAAGKDEELESAAATFEGVFGAGVLAFGGGVAWLGANLGAAGWSVATVEPGSNASVSGVEGGRWDDVPTVADALGMTRAASDTRSMERVLACLRCCNPCVLLTRCLLVTFKELLVVFAASAACSAKPSEDCLSLASIGCSEARPRLLTPPYHHRPLSLSLIKLERPAAGGPSGWFA